MNFKETFKKINWKHVFILLLIFLVAFGFRAHVLRYDLMFGFDGYWHARLNADMIKTNSIPHYDLVGTYHNANKGSISLTHGPVFWMFGYAIYKVFTLGAPYHQDWWLFFVRLLPALYGALTALAVYLLFRWAYKSKVLGYLAGFITAVMPAFIYRTMGGFYEEDSMGFLWMVLGFAFLVRAVREPELTKQKIIYATISGVMFGMMALIWDVFVIVPVLIEAYFILTLLWNLYKKADKKVLKALTVLFLISFLIAIAFRAPSDGFDWAKMQASYASGILGIHGGANVLNTSSGVGEESAGKAVFGKKFGLFNIFILLGIIAFIYALYRRKHDYTSFLFGLWALFTFYLAWNKLKATYWFGLGLAIFTAFTFAELYFYLNSLKKDGTGLKVASVLLGVLVLAGGVASGVFFVHYHAPSIDSSPNWHDTILFMQKNLPENAKMFNWWNWGHWITFIGHKRASTDNTNSDYQANRDFSNFDITTDLNVGLGTIKAYDSDYIVLSGEDIAKQAVYGYYAYNLKNYNDYRLKLLSGGYAGCHKQTNPVNNAAMYFCGGYKLTEKQIDGLSTSWQKKPTEIMQNKVPVFIYTNKAKTGFWLLTARNNDSFGAKLWFGSPELSKYFSLVYDNGYQRIWKVNKDAFKDVKPYMLDMNQQQIKDWNSKLWWLKKPTTS